jgi:TRAP transporter T-component
MVARMSSSEYQAGVRRSSEAAVTELARRAAARGHRSLPVAAAALVLVPALVLGACDPARFAAATAADLTARTGSAFSRESEVELARAAAPAGLKQLEGFLLVAGPRRPLLAALTEAFCGWGAGFLQDDWERDVLERGGDGAEALASARLALGRCARYAAMQLPPPLAQLLDPTVPAAAVTAALDGARRVDVEPLYWLATAHAALLGMTGELTLAIHVPRLLAMLRRINQLEPALAHGQAHALLGVLLASIPIFGDLEAAEREFATARAVTAGRFLLVDVLAARALAVARGDRAQFTALLTRALTTSPAALPEARLANELALRMAKRYLRHGGRWFPSPSASSRSSPPPPTP